MVTPAGKELLKNTINTVKLHNRILEENEMWRHWNLEKGLTMMVSDDLFRGEKSLDQLLKKKKKKKKHKEKHKRDKHSSSKSRHSSRNGLKVADSSADRWDHSGFEELYPESKPSTKTDSLEVKRSSKEAGKKHKPSVSNASPSTYSDSSDSKEVWKEFKSSKKRRHRDSSNDRVPKFRKCDNGDFDQKIGNKHKNDDTTFRKREDCKLCDSRHCHRKHEKKAKNVSPRHS